MNRKYPFYHCLSEKKNIKQIVQDMVDENPDHILFRFRKDSDIVQKTAGEFLSDINAAGTWLYHCNIQNTHVALSGPNSYYWLVLFFAVISSSNTIVPVDPDLDPQTMTYVLDHSESSCVFTTKQIQNRLRKAASEPDSKEQSAAGSDPQEASSLRRYYLLTDLDSYLEEGRRLTDEGQTQFQNEIPDTARMSAIVYTSGTTGRPRGVMLSQDNLLFDINHGCCSYNPGKIFLSTLPFHHMFGLVVSLLMPLNWKCTVFLNSGVRYLAPDLKLVRPESTMLVPLHIQSFHKLIMQKAKKEGKYKKLRRGMKLSLFLYRFGIDVRARLMKEVREAFGSEMKYILVGGAALEPFYEKEFRAFGIDIRTAYGATECSPGIAVNRNFYFREGSCGLPVETSHIKTAEDGELLVKGGHVMLGYYRDPEETARVLTDGWYHTGDIGYLDQDGFVFITGRKKNLIITANGENVSPEVLESKLSLIPGVAEVLVYEEQGSIAAEIFPASDLTDYMAPGQQAEAYFKEQTDRLNETLPLSRRINTIRIRDTEFPKNSSKKIVRALAEKERKEHV